MQQTPQKIGRPRLRKRLDSYRPVPSHTWSWKDTVGKYLTLTVGGGGNPAQGLGEGSYTDAPPFFHRQKRRKSGIRVRRQPLCDASREYPGD